MTENLARLQQMRLKLIKDLKICVLMGVAGVKERCGWLSPIFTYSGEVEQEAMYEEALEVVEGRKRANSYSGSPIFKGFDWDKN